MDRAYLFLLDWDTLPALRPPRIVWITLVCSSGLGCQFSDPSGCSFCFPFSFSSRWELSARNHFKCPLAMNVFLSHPSNGSISPCCAHNRNGICIINPLDIQGRPYRTRCLSSLLFYVAGDFGGRAIELGIMPWGEVRISMLLVVYWMTLLLLPSCVILEKVLILLPRMNSRPHRQACSILLMQWLHQKLEEDWSIMTYHILVHSFLRPLMKDAIVTLSL